MPAAEDGRADPMTRGFESRERGPEDSGTVIRSGRGRYSSAKALTPVVTTTTYCLPFGAM